MAFTKPTGLEHSVLQAEIHDCNRELGWYDKPVSFIEMMALLGTEVTEANDAVRQDGLLGRRQARPQQASELADCYIRLADDFSRLGLNLASVVDTHQYSYETYPWKTDDGASIGLFRRIRDAIEIYRDGGMESIGAGEFVPSKNLVRAMAYIYLHIEDMCEWYEVALREEVQSKIAINWTRGYRHGNKRA